MVNNTMTSKSLDDESSTLPCCWGTSEDDVLSVAQLKFQTFEYSYSRLTKWMQASPEQI